LFFTASIQLIQRYLTNESLGGFGDFKIGRKVIRNVKYVENFVVQGMIDRLIGWKMLWNELECAENEGNENVKGTISRTRNDRSKTTE
jgi:hypothetical protein